MSRLIPYCPRGCHADPLARKGCPEHKIIGPPSGHGSDGFMEGTSDREKWLHSLPYDEYLETDDWQRKRKHMLARSDYRCNGCGANKDLQVHHLTYERRGYERNEDLVVLCRACHRAAHGLVAS